MKLSTIALLTSISATSEAFQVGAPSSATVGVSPTALEMRRVSCRPSSRRFRTPYSSKMFRDLEEGFCSDGRKSSRRFRSPSKMFRELEEGFGPDVRPSSRRFRSPSKMFRELEEGFGPDVDDFFYSPFLMRPATPFLNSLNRALYDLAGGTFRPPYNYEITDEDDKVQLTAELPGVKASDISVQIERGGRVLRLSGVREVSQGSMAYKQRFDKAFMLDRDVDVENISANLADGVLTITVTKSSTLEETNEKIEIRKGEPPSEAEGEVVLFTLDVPGVKAIDMNIELEEGGRVVRLNGVRKVMRNGSTFESPIERSFTVSRGVDTDRITAYLANGVITVTAPKREKIVKNVEINAESAEAATEDETKNMNLEDITAPAEEQPKQIEITEEGGNEEENPEEDDNEDEKPADESD